MHNHGKMTTFALGKMKDKVAGYTEGALGAVMAGLVYPLAMVLIGEGIDIVSILFMRNVVALPFVYLALRQSGRRVDIGTSRILPICLLGIATACSSYCVLDSLTGLYMAEASAIYYTYPLLVTLLMAGLYHERLSTAAFACILSCLIALPLIGMVATGGPAVARSIIMVLVASVLYAAFFVAIHARGLVAVSSQTMTFWLTLTGAFIFGVIIMVRGYAMVPHTPLPWLWVLLMALCPTVLSYQFTSRSVRRIGYTAASALGVFEPLTALVASYVFFSQNVSLKGLIAVALIMASVTVLVYTRNVSRRIRKLRQSQPAVPDRK